MLGDPDNPVWDDPRFVAWWAEREAARARDGVQRVADGEYLAAGRALIARVEAKRLGVTRVREVPAWRYPSVPGMPAQVLAAAAAQRAAPVADTGSLAAAAGEGRDLWDTACTAWVDLPAAVPPGKYLALRVRGDSMLPLIASGDLALVRLDPAIRVDTVVIARHPDDGYVCKRVRRIGREVVELVSVAPEGPAFRIPRDERLIVGTVAAVWDER